MGIMDRISNAKAGFRKVQRAIEGGHREEAVKEATKLGITTEQVKARRIEEKARFHDTYRAERMKQIKAKALEKARQGPAIQRFAKGLKRTMDASRERGQVKQQNVFSTGSKPLEMGSSGLSMGGTPKKAKIPTKKKQIIINY